MTRSTLALLACLLVACGQGTGPEVSIDREAFVSTYVALRVATLTGGFERLPPDVRDSVLDEHGVTEEQLLDFAEAHGRDIRFMERIWDEIEARLDTVASPAGTGDLTP